MHVGVRVQEGDQFAVIGQNLLQFRGGLLRTAEFQRLGGVEEFYGQHGFHIVHHPHKLCGRVGAH